MARQEQLATDLTGAGTSWAGLLLPQKLSHLPGHRGPDGLSGSAAAVGLWPAAPWGVSAPASCCGGHVDPGGFRMCLFLLTLRHRLAAWTRVMQGHMGPTGRLCEVVPV